MTADLRVVVLDRGAPPDINAPLPSVPELRVSTITPASIQLFRDVGAWEDIEPRSAPFAHMQVKHFVAPAFCTAAMRMEAMVSVLSFPMSNDCATRSGMREAMGMCATAPRLWACSTWAT